MTCEGTVLSCKIEHHSTTDYKSRLLTFLFSNEKRAFLSTNNVSFFFAYYNVTTPVELSGGIQQESAARSIFHS
jgi:hypothetical protein